jgi:hypothetical protein
VVAVTTIGLGLGGCSTIPVASGYTDGRIGVAVNPFLGQDVVLEIGDRAWGFPDGGDAVVLVEASGTTPVRLVRPSDCAVIVSFAGQPNGRYVIDATSELEADWRDISNEGFPMGPGNDETELTGCP